MRLVPFQASIVDGQSDGSGGGIVLALVSRSTLRLARHRLRDHLTSFGLDPDDACLILSELAGNALLHGGETAAVAWCLCGDRLHIGVADGSALGLAVIQENCAREGGRGLLLVDQLAKEWGVRPLGALGKAAWCELQVRAA
ncbi:ATP-binding protein [Kitasatospora acidiphila]|uniref:ATP-binding protein n=1 Tax=Kitasatospora acidiphila TaxID=2567942 RepID=A0A540VWQ1_9ACTN|nr:ATP-binding protein [Kitasatospora acidiphila]TQF01193.1 ATP-binding protein [Kitasatospora acidiphila]